MLKFFRKYNKIILAVFGSILMVVFLLPEAINQIAAPTGRTVATLAGEDISAMEMDEYGLELAVLQNISPMIYSGNAAAGGGLLRVDDEEHWLLVRTLAERAGYVGGPQDGRNLLARVADEGTTAQIRNLVRQNPFLRQSVTPDLIDSIKEELLAQMDANRAGQVGAYGTEQDINMTLARAAGVIRMYEAYLDSAELYGLEAIALARADFDQVIADIVRVQPARLMSQVEEPTEEEIRAHFEEYKGVRPGEGEHGFGFLRDEAAAIEWLTIDPQAIRNSIEPDPIEVYARFQRQRESRWADREFQEVRGQIVRAMQQEQTQRIVEEATQLVRAELLKASGNLRSDGRFKRLPEDWESRRPALASVARKASETLRERHGIDGNAVTATEGGALLTANAMRTLQSIGAATLNYGGRAISFPELVFSARELDPESPFGVQLGLTYERPVTGPTGRLHFFRVLRVRDETPPDSLEEVRGAIVTNLKRLRAFEMLSDQSDEYVRLAAGEGGLESIADQFGGFVEEGVIVRISGMQYDEQGGVVPGDINTEVVREAIMERAEALDPRVDVSALEDPTGAIVAVPVEDSLHLVVAKIVSNEPIAVENFRDLAPFVRVPLDRIGSPLSADWPYTKARLAERLGFEALERPDQTPVGAEEGVEEESVGEGASGEGEMG